MLQVKEEVSMSKSPKDGAPGTTDQFPRWEGPEENRPRGAMRLIQARRRRGDRSASARELLRFGNVKAVRME